jgi:hypothetical protein
MEWTYDALWAKSKLYMERALNADRDSAEFPFFAILALEFLARSVLAKLHPSLLADPQDANSILYANGIPATDKPRSVPAKTVFVRVKSVVTDFSKEDEAQCLKFAELRNRELHSGGAPFEAMPTGTWLPEFYAVVGKLMGHLKRDLTDLLGKEEATAARRIIAESFQEDRAMVEKLRAETIKNFNYLTSAEQKKRIEEHDPKVISARFASGEIGRVAKCPCCGNQGWQLGDVTGQRPPIIDGNEIVAKLIVTPKAYACKICGFKLTGYGKLRIVNLADQFEYSDSLDPVEYFGIEPMDYITEEQMREHLADDGYFNE